MPETTAEKTVIIRNRYGLHARPAALFVELCNRFVCQVSVVKGTATVNGKNILDIMTLGADCGTELVLRAAGPDAESAIQQLAELVENNFGEN